jgi:hypothetical protein
MWESGEVASVEVLLVVVVVPNIAGCSDGDECMRLASPLIDQEESSGASFVLIFWSAFKTKSSIILFYCCLDSWTVPLSSIIVLAIVRSLYIPFALSSDALSSCVFFGFSSWDGLPRPNDQSKNSAL